MSNKDTVTVSVDITNTGDYDGKEVAQLYIRDIFGSVTRPVKELKGFQKIFLKKGETKTVTFTISVEDLKFYNANIDFVAEPGDFQIAIGTDSNVAFKNSLTLLD
jgi:beta-glucosidase